MEIFLHCWNTIISSKSEYLHYCENMTPSTYLEFGCLKQNVFFFISYFC